MHHEETSSFYLLFQGSLSVKNSISFEQYLWNSHWAQLIFLWRRHKKRTWRSGIVVAVTIIISHHFSSTLNQRTKLFSFYRCRCSYEAEGMKRCSFDISAMQSNKMSFIISGINLCVDGRKEKTRKYSLEVMKREAAESLHEETFLRLLINLFLRIFLCFTALVGGIFMLIFIERCVTSGVGKKLLFAFVFRSS